MQPLTGNGDVSIEWKIFQFGDKQTNEANKQINKQTILLRIEYFQLANFVCMRENMISKWTFLVIWMHYRFRRGREVYSTNLTLKILRQQFDRKSILNLQIHFPTFYQSWKLKQMSLIEQVMTEILLVNVWAIAYKYFEKIRCIDLNPLTIAVYKF